MSKLSNNINKLTYLALEYPEKTITELGKMFSMSVLDINVMIWKAKEDGFLKINKKTGKVDVLKFRPGFDPTIEELKDNIVYAFKKLAENKSDITDYELGQWAAGYNTQDYAVAVKQLLGQKILHQYELTNVTEIPASKKARGRGKKPEKVEDTYTFYTLYENGEQEWGRAQFKDSKRLK